MYDGMAAIGGIGREEKRKVSNLDEGKKDGN